jgi:hypothetical protein
MSDNRYAPPTAPVQEVVPERMLTVRPREIVWAVQLAVVGYLLGLVLMFVSWDYFSKLQSMGSLISNQVISLGISVWLYFKIWAGRNWARITLLVFSLLGALMAFSSLFMNLLAAAPMIFKVEMYVGFGINLVILWLLFMSPGKEWFKTRG